jgi:putative intracellular protease/amidase
MSLFNVGFVIFPELTQLDFTGPQQVLARLPQSAMHIIAKSAAPVSSDSGLSLVPTHTFENCPRLDLICIPGGSTGVVRAMGDRDTIEFVRRRSVMAKYVTSVCTGAFILGAAGLLKGRRATTHWAFTELLPLVGPRMRRAASSRTATSSPRAALRLESTLASTWWPRLPARLWRRRFNSVSSMIRTHLLTRAIPIARPMPPKPQSSLDMKRREPRFAMGSLAYP